MLSLDGVRITNLSLQVLDVIVLWQLKVEV